VAVAVPAAGSGSRLGGKDKGFLELGGEPVLVHAMRPFLDHPFVVSIAVALAPRLALPPPEWLVSLDPRIRVVAGAETRSGSVLAALEAVGSEVDVIVIHDGARPLVTREIIDRCIGATTEGEGAIAGWPAVDTLKEVDSRGRVLATPDRSRLWRAQTPQAFPYAKLLDAYRRGVAEGLVATDDAELFTRAGGTVRVVEGAPWNLKLTYPGDLPLAELLLARRAEAPRRG
jgi:2-C-methyl-D-erythritol 4-phosphate cytidylyltransferase